MSENPSTDPYPHSQVTDVCAARIEAFGLERAYELTVDDLERRDATGADTTRQRQIADRLIAIIHAEDASRASRIA